MSINPTGIPARSAPAVYHGVALYIVRDEQGNALVAYDGNGTAVFLNDGLTLDIVDLPVPYDGGDIAWAIQ